MENNHTTNIQSITPFTEILDDLDKLIWKEGHDESLTVFCNLQMNLLNTIYCSMVEFDLRLLRQSDTAIAKKIDKAEFFLGYGKKHMEVEKAFLDYFSFINILNQFGRVLTNKYNLPALTIPGYFRIYFFRNKVLEHWDDYTGSINYGAMTQIYGKPAIPVVQNSQSLTELTSIRKKVISYFAHREIRLEIPEGEELLNLSLADPEYHRGAYDALEKIDPQLRHIDEKITKLLFDFGFPVPIFDVAEYCVSLVDSIKKIIPPALHRSI